MAESPARLLLRVSVKLLFLLALLPVLYALFSSVTNGTGQPRAMAPRQIQFGALQENQALHSPGRGGNLILVKRSAATLASLQADVDGLLDPASTHALQPEGLPAATRSVQPELFVAFDRGTDMGCPLAWIPPGSREAPRQPWHGGFRDTCQGSWYDAAGRVFKGQQAGRNLDIPPYRHAGGDLLEIGLSGDNATPAN